MERLMDSRIGASIGRLDGRTDGYTSLHEGMCLGVEVNVLNLAST